jgi:3-dehydroquinate dehydratase-1
MPENIDEILRNIKKVEKFSPDFIEIRLDKIEISDFKKIAVSTNTPLIATNRAIHEGGFFAGNDRERIKILLEAAKEGFNYIDLELSTKNLAELVKRLHGLKSNVIISYHDFKKTPSIKTINEIFSREVNKGADICKIVTTARKFEDNLKLLNFVYCNYKKARIVCFAMGESGKISRFISPMLGAHFTFASIEEGEETAPGQLEINRMRELYESLGLNP